MKKFLLIDDHYVVRSGMKGLLHQLFRPVEVYEAENSDKATELIKHQQFDMIIMDVQIPGSDMMGLMEYIHTRYPGARVLVFSMSPENIYAKRFLKAGAKGFLSKDSSVEEYTKAINLVLSGRKYISESLAQVLADNSLADTPNNPFDKLSPREFEIAMKLLEGIQLSEISKSLHLQPSTVGTHKAKLFKKMSITNLMQLKEMAGVYLDKQ